MTALPAAGLSALLLAGAGHLVRSLHLYSNVVDLDVAELRREDFEEPSAPSYRPRTVSPRDWSVAGDGVVQTRAFIFRLGAAARICGFFVADAAGRPLWAQQVEPEPWNVPAGDPIEVIAAVAPAASAW